MFPARNQRLDAPDSLNGYFMFVNGGANTFESFNVRVGKEALVAAGLSGKNQSFSFIEPDGFY
jgi:hypothetical protein